MTDSANQAASCCSTAGHAENPAADTSKQNLLAPAADDATTCVVMPGTPVSKSAAEAAGLYRDYEGNRYWFCCAGCGPAFDANPQQYAAA